VSVSAQKDQHRQRQPYDATSTSVTPQVLALKAAGANVFIIFALPSQTIGHS